MLKDEGQISDLNIDYAIITHPHDDHYVGYKYLCSKDENSKDFSLAHLYYSVEAEKPSYGGFLDCLQTLNGNTQSYGQISARGPPIDIGDGIEITVFYPFEPIDKPNKDKNDDSVVLKIKYNNVSFLLTGDASSNIEKQLLDKDINSNVLKLGHHASKTASSSDFLNKVKPDGAFYVVISSNDKDYKNKYGHPNKQTLDRVYAQDNVLLFRTDLEGTIVFTTDGESINVKTEKAVASEKQLWKPGVKPKSPEK